MTIKERYAGVIEYFKASGVVPQSELEYSDNFSLLVAVMLSAQCTDKRVNMVTPALMAAFPTAERMACAKPDEVFNYIKSVSYPNSKAEHLVQMAKRLVSDFGGQVPSTREELETLEGVGRKTANVMLAVAFGKSAMPVDTHVARVSLRIGLAEGVRNPQQIERQLVKYIPAELCGNMHHWLLLHGRYVCTARVMHCEECGINQYCKKYVEIKKEKEKRG